VEYPSRNPNQGGRGSGGDDGGAGGPPPAPPSSAAPPLPPPPAEVIEISDDEGDGGALPSPPSPLIAITSVVGGGGGGGGGGTVAGLAHVATTDPMQHCINTMRRMGSVVAACAEHGDRIAWHLPPLGQDPVVWATAHIDRILAQGYVRCFKVGITYLVAERWSDPAHGYRTLKYHRLHVLAASDSSDDIANAETAVIGRYRRYGPGGQLISSTGHPLCANRNPGGEGAHHGVPPHCLYCAFAWHRRGG